MLIRYQQWAYQWQEHPVESLCGLNQIDLHCWIEAIIFNSVQSLQINFWVPSLTGFLCLYFQFLGFVCTFLQSHNYCQITALYLQSTSLDTVPSLGYSQLNHFWQWIVFLFGESSISRAYIHILTTIHTQTTVKVITCLTLMWKIKQSEEMQHRRRAISTRSPAVLDEEMINQGNGWGHAFSFLRCFDTAGLTSNVKLEEEVKQHGECLCIHTLTHAQTYT